MLYLSWLLQCWVNWFTLWLDLFEILLKPHGILYLCLFSNKRRKNCSAVQLAGRPLELREHFNCRLRSLYFAGVTNYGCCNNRSFVLRDSIPLFARSFSGLFGPYVSYISLPFTLNGCMDILMESGYLCYVQCVGTAFSSQCHMLGGYYHTTNTTRGFNRL